MEEKKIHRAFVAIDFPESIIKEVARVQEVLWNFRFTGKMTELENLHLTLKFFGEIDDAMLDKVKERLQRVEVKEMDLRLGKIGTFGMRGKPRIVWIKIDGRDVFELQRRVDSVLDGLFEKENRFMSHMTIARVKYVKDAGGFREYVRGIGIKEVRFKIGKFKLKESELWSFGPLYKDLEVYSFY